MIEEELKRLPDLFTMTGRDWHIEIKHCMTEPTLPTIVIYEEGELPRSISRYRVRFDGPDLYTAVKDAVDHILIDLPKIQRLCKKE